MKRRKAIIAFGICLFCSILNIGFSQNTNEENKFSINFSGYIKNDVFYDTRQTIGGREGHLLLYPKKVKLDSNGEDINATPNFHMLAIQTRVATRITGPEVFGAKTSGVIESEFFGHSDSDISGLRLRHAFFKLNWEKSELIAGQYWHPLFSIRAFPETVSFNTGVPILPFARNPQLRYSYITRGITLVATAYVLRDFPASGPNGTSTSIQRNAGVPNLNASIIYESKEKGNVIGASADFKTILPEMETSLGFKTGNKLRSFSYAGFTKLNINKITFKTQGIIAQNAFDIMSIGGYATILGSENIITGEKDYTNYRTASVWSELSYSIKNTSIGVFTGYSKNLGTDKVILDTNTPAEVFARGHDIDHIFRISPKIAVRHNNTTIAFELEYTSAAYGTPSEKGLVKNFEEVSNLRALVAFIYSFNN